VIRTEKSLKRCTKIACDGKEMQQKHAEVKGAEERAKTRNTKRLKHVQVYSCGFHSSHTGQSLVYASVMRIDAKARIHDTGQETLAAGEVSTEVALVGTELVVTFVAALAAGAAVVELTEA